MRKSGMISLGMLLLTLAAPRTLALDAAAPTWLPPERIFEPGLHVVDPANHLGADRILEFDHYGRPGVVAAYESAGDPSLRELGFFRRNALGWSRETLLGTTNVFTARWPSLAYDRYERPAVTAQYGGMNLYYAHWNGESWDQQWLNSLQHSNVGYYSFVAFDLYGRPAIAHYDAENGDLRMWYDTSGDFRFDPNGTEEQVVQSRSFGYLPALAFDPMNRPVIAHLDQPRTDGSWSLQLSMRDIGVSWNTITLDRACQGRGLSMGVNPVTGQPAVAYQRSDGNLVYRWTDGNSWQEHTFSGDAWFTAGGYEPSLAFDPADGHPAVAYVNWQQDLVFSWFDGDSWQAQRLDSTGYFANPSLAFNEYGSGWPAIAYFDQYTGMAYFIEDPQGVPEPASTALLLAGAATLLYRRNRAVPRHFGRRAGSR